MGSQKIKPQQGSVDRLPPHNVEAEQAVLGAMLLNEKIVPDIVDSLAADLFYKDSHKKIFTSIFELYNSGRNVDIITVSNSLRSKNELEPIGGKLYLTKLVENVPSIANARSYVSIIRDNGLLRQLINASFDIVNLCHSQYENIDEVLDEAEKLVFDVNQQKTDSAVSIVGDVIHDTIEKIQDLYNNKSHVTGIATGFKDFDKMTSGLHGGELIILAARPAMGKTSFAANIMEHAALDLNQPTLFFSCEMTKESITQRLLCTRGMLDGNKVRTGYLDQEHDWPRLTGAASEISKAPLFISDSISTLYELRSECRRMKVKHDIQLIIIDYLQLLSKGGRVESRQMEITEISRALKKLSIELNVPIIALSQLSRQVESREDRKPRLSDLRESGAIEQDADVVVFLYRDEYYNPESPDKGMGEVIISKQRNGPTGNLKLAFMKEYMKFADLDRYHPDSDS